MADEFADVDPALLAKGIEILAASWTIPTVVFRGAADGFAKADDWTDASKVEPTCVIAEGERAVSRAPCPVVNLFPDNLRSRIEDDNIFGETRRRR